MSMVEIVARAIFKAWLMREGLKLAEAQAADPVALMRATVRAIEENWADFVSEARAAIEAMREPTEVMMYAGADDFFESATIGLSEYTAQDVWRRMIDAALKDTP